ncbi:MAG: zinc ribbon domain-containing protein, partial [Thermoplasmata archaeon]|nr:zinc ribbon domain-containing protein [Thermoplasmata archaeon]
LIFFNTDPTNWDSDNDGTSDGLEDHGYNAKIDILTDGWIRMNIYWQTYVITIETNSSVLSATFDSVNQELSVDVGGKNGTKGVTNIFAPIAMIKNAEEIDIKFDDESINFTLDQNETYYIIHVEYNHSTHRLTMTFKSLDKEPPEEGDEGEAQIGEIIAYVGIVIIILIVIILIGVMVFKRKPAKKIKYYKCRKCGEKLEVPFSSDEKIRLECTECSAKRRILNPYLKAEAKEAHEQPPESEKHKKKPIKKRKKVPKKPKKDDKLDEILDKHFK